jgi:menaquinone-9 beta-reductase
MDGKQNFQSLGTAQHPWDVVVIGAGPAGALAAILLARHCLAVLLIDRKIFPRDKVCGGCLSARGVATLRRAGLNHVLLATTTAPIERLELYGRRQHVTTPLSGGVAILRSEFDAQLVSIARECGASFLTETTASLTSVVQNCLRRIELKSDGRARDDIFARVVLACDGLGGSSVSRLPNFRQVPSRHSRIGVGAIIECDDDRLRAGSLCMAIGRCGYVGRVRLGDRRISLAAALDPTAIRELGPAAAVQSVLEDCGLSGLSEYSRCRVQGTLPLTRRSKRVADHGLFLVGDACGYVEPFTGEGMALALEAAEAVVPFVIAAQKGWQPSFANDWERTVRKITAQRHAICRGLSTLCRQPWLVDATLAASYFAPKIFNSLVTFMNRIPQELESIHAWDSTF